MKVKDKIKDLSKMQDRELRNLMREKAERLRQFRFDLVSGKVRNAREIRETRRDIARVKTFLKSNIQEKK